MRHIKIYEDYSDDELMDLLGDMKSIGQAELRIEIKDGHRSGMSSQEREEEKEFLSSWFFDSPKGKIKITSALMDYSAGESKIALKMNNGDVFEMKWSNSDSAQYFIDGREIYLESEQEEEGIENSDFPLEFASAGAVLMYKLYLEKKFKGSPSLLQRLKGKLGIKESEYSDEELRDLLGDMRSIGQSKVNLDIDYGPFTGMGEKEKKEERDVADNWSFKTPQGDITVKSGSIKFSPKKEGEIILNMTNGDVIRMKDEKGDEPLFYVNDKLIINSKGDNDIPYIEEYPYASAALARYKLHLEKKFKESPSLLQRLKAKLGLKESEYSDEELKDLLDNMRSVGQSLTEEEEDMLQFVNQFGGGMSAEDYAESLYDYFKNPGDYDIDPEGDYYDMIWYLYENSVEDHSRFDLQGPMRMSMSPNWNIDGISEEPLYKMYLKMSDYYRKAKR